MNKLILTFAIVLYSIMSIGQGKVEQIRPPVNPVTNTILCENSYMFYSGGSIAAVPRWVYEECDEEGNVTIKDCKTDATLAIIPFCGPAETVTTLVDNGDGSFTYTSEDGTVTTYGESTTVISLGTDKTSIDYLDEDGNTTNLNLCDIVDNCETLTSLTYNAATSTITYTDENGDTFDIVLDGNTESVTYESNDDQMPTFPTLPNEGDTYINDYGSWTYDGTDWIIDPQCCSYNYEVITGNPLLNVDTDTVGNSIIFDLDIDSLELCNFILGKTSPIANNITPATFDFTTSETTGTFSYTYDTENKDGTCLDASCEVKIVVCGTRSPDINNAVWMELADVTVPMNTNPTTVTGNNWDKFVPYLTMSGGTFSPCDWQSGISVDLDKKSWAEDQSQYWDGTAWVSGTTSPNQSNTLLNAYVHDEAYWNGTTYESQAMALKFKFTTICGSDITPTREVIIERWKDVVYFASMAEHQSSQNNALFVSVSDNATPLSAASFDILTGPCAGTYNHVVPTTGNTNLCNSGAPVDFSVGPAYSDACSQPISLFVSNGIGENGLTSSFENYVTNNGAGQNSFDFGFIAIYMESPSGGSLEASTFGVIDVNSYINQQTSTTAAGEDPTQFTVLVNGINTGLGTVCAFPTRFDMPIVSVTPTIGCGERAVINFSFESTQYGQTINGTAQYEIALKW